MGQNAADAVSQVLNSLYLLPMLFMIQPSMELVFISARMHRRLVLNVVSISPPGLFLQSCFPFQLVPGLLSGITLSQLQDLAFPFVEFFEVSLRPSHTSLPLSAECFTLRST